MIFCLCDPLVTFYDIMDIFSCCGDDLKRAFGRPKKVKSNIVPLCWFVNLCFALIIISDLQI